MFSRSGAYPDPLAEMERNRETLFQLAQFVPGSPAHKRALAKFASMRGEALTELDLEIAPPEQGAPPPQEQEAPPPQ